MALLVLAGGLSAQTGPPQGWRDAPAWLPLFTPASPAGAYRAAISPADLDTVIRALSHDPSLVRTPGAWTPRAQFVLDAFGKTGSYDRWTLTRLYGSRQPRVARGARMEDGRVVESWTLISPYPDPRLERLESGTLLIVLTVP